MSAALGGFAVKALTGAIIGKVVGKVTGNDKIGMIAALVSGTAMAGGVSGVTEAARCGGGLLSAGADIIKENPAAATIGANVVSGAAQGYLGGKQQEEALAAEERQAKLNREAEFELQRRQQEADAAAYARKTQGYGVAPAGGLLPSTTVPEPTTSPSGVSTVSPTVPPTTVPTTPTVTPPLSAPQEYFQRFQNMYRSTGVR